MFGVEKTNEVGKQRNDMAKFFLFSVQVKLYDVCYISFKCNVWNLVFFVKYQKGKKTICTFALTN
jgi:hypothetical protein